jgi:hypothetical protein
MKSAEKAKWNTAIATMENLHGTVDARELHATISNALHLAPIMRADLWEAIKTQSFLKAIGA